MVEKGMAPKFCCSTSRSLNSRVSAFSGLILIVLFQIRGWARLEGSAKNLARSKQGKRLAYPKLGAIKTLGAKSGIEDSYFRPRCLSLIFLHGFELAQAQI